MGQGQTKEAILLVRKAARDGRWVLLKNLHLVVAWLPTLEKEMISASPHGDFRLWLTSEQHPEFPPILLQQSIKVTIEAPPGVKQNLKRTYEGWDSTFLSDKSPQLAQILFALAWFHAVVQERRSYIPQGWTKFYEFSSADLRSGVLTACIPWAPLVEVFVGGSVG